MGYVLFTSSGTFKPADYGLAPGDTIQIAAIGGGAGGAGSGGSGSAGSASSFGSILTAPGGTACTAPNSSGALSEGMLPGTDKGVKYSPNNDNTKHYGVGGQGGPGWMPGEAREYFELFCQLYHNSTSGTITNGVVSWQKAAPSFKQQAASVIPFGASGIDANINGSQYFYPGVGGRGYGAGGGGAVGGIGGNSGALRHASYTLPSTAAIAVTVGNGGAGGYYSSASYFAGGGARGCVAVFW